MSFTVFGQHDEATIEQLRRSAPPRKRAGRPLRRRSPRLLGRISFGMRRKSAEPIREHAVFDAIKVEHVLRPRVVVTAGPTTGIPTRTERWPAHACTAAASSGIMIS